MHAFIIYPNQLFESFDFPLENNKILIVQDSLFFKLYNFHKQKLILHRASMKYYQSFLESKGYEVIYLETEIDLVKNLKKVKKVTVYDLSDNWLEKKLRKTLNKANIVLEIIDSPNFLTPLDWANKYFDEQPKYFFTDFYIERRKRLKLLIDKNNKPIGGKWSFDVDNRKKLPKGHTLPKVWQRKENNFVIEAIAYVEKNYADNPGKSKLFNYPVTHNEALEQYEYFLENKFELFGDYEDAIAKDESLIYHSCLTAALNVGLITPEVVIKKALKYKADVGLNNLEGFVRQVIGWREYVHALYSREHIKQRTTNHFRFTRKIPRSFWNANTGIDPIDNTIKKILDNSYCHHIERLMVMGNFMLLCEFDPDEVYLWFMELFIDAYDWVMVPNVYGMSQYADGGLITTKPYISSSNYVLKMSDYEKGSWCEIWDALYWRFIDKHRTVFEKNPRMGIMPKQLDKMEVSKRQKHLEVAEAFLSTLI